NEELRRTQAELDAVRALYDLAPMGYVILSEQGLIVKANLTAATLLGADRDELVRQPVSRFIFQEDADIYHVHRKQLFATDEPQVCELRMLKKDQAVFWARVEASLAQGPDGEPFCRVVLSDISERKRTEKSLAVAHQQRLAILESITDGFFSLDRQWRVGYVNERGAGLLGKSCEELLGKNLWESFPQADALPFRQAYERALAEQVSTHIEAFFSPLSAWFEAHAYPSSEGLSVFYQNISDRKQSEAVTLRYQLIAQYARDPLLLIARDGRIIEANQAAVQLYGYTHDELLGLKIYTLHQDDAEVVDLQMERGRGQGILFETTHVCKDGSAVPVEVSSRSVILAGEEMHLSVIRNITRRKETELKLIGAKEDAERASQAKSDFLASMSHELRTPLNAIMGFSQVLENEYFGTLNDKQKEYINDIYESGKHLLSLINDILELSKIEAGKMEPHWSCVNVESLLEHSRVFVREKCFKHDIHLDFEIDESVKGLKIRLDERRFKQIMYNLLSNAAKFTPGGGAIRVRARLIEADDPALEVSVSDTGIGIAPEHQENIFEAFYQVHQETSNKTPGTGLGLSLVKQLVSLHGGRIWLVSEGKGHGSRFTFVLPVKEHASEIPMEGPW
ncbi:MAG: PAS domain S-box protein, partial [bacterium]